MCKPRNTRAAVSGRVGFWCGTWFRIPPSPPSSPAHPHSQLHRTLKSANSPREGFEPDRGFDHLCQQVETSAQREARRVETAPAVSINPAPYALHSHLDPNEPASLTTPTLNRSPSSHGRDLNRGFDYLRQVQVATGRAPSANSNVVFVGNAAIHRSINSLPPSAPPLTEIQSFT